MSGADLRVVETRPGLSHYQDPEYDGETSTHTLCGRSGNEVSVIRITKSGDAECPTCQEAAEEVAR